MVLPSVWTRVFAQVVGVALLTLGLLAAAELGLREALPLRKVCLEAHPERLYRAVPDCAHVYVRQPVNGAEPVLVRFGPAGFRGADPDPERARPRVMVYGDSFIEAEYTRQDETFAARLSDRLGAEVLNAGVKGYGPDQAYLRMRDEVDRFAPDLVVLSVFVGNDLGDVMRNRLFVMDARGQIVRSAPEVDPAAYETFEASARGAGRPALVKAAEALSLAIRPKNWRDISTGYAERCLAARADEWARLKRADHRLRTVFGDGWDVHVAADPSSPHAQYNLRLFGHVLSEVDALLSEREIPWLLLVIPDAIDVAEGYDLTFDATAHPAYRPSNLVASVKEIADAQAIRHVDATPALVERAGARHYFRGGNSHWNAVGQDRVADAVAARIRTEALLPIR